MGTLSKTMQFSIQIAGEPWKPKMFKFVKPLYFPNCICFVSSSPLCYVESVPSPDWSLGETIAGPFEVACYEIIMLIWPKYRNQSAPVTTRTDTVWVNYSLPLPGAQGSRVRGVLCRLSRLVLAAPAHAGWLWAAFGGAAGGPSVPHWCFGESTDSCCGVSGASTGWDLRERFAEAQPARTARKDAAGGLVRIAGRNT